MTIGLDWGQEQIGARPGFTNSSGTCKIGIRSLSNATVTVNGQTVTMTAVGTTGSAKPVGISQAGFTGVATLTNLPAFPSKTTYTVTQSGETITGEVYGYVNPGADFSVLYGACDRTTGTASDPWNSPHGIYPVVYDLCQDSDIPVVGAVLVDDSLYSETYAINDTASGHIASATARDSGGEYPRAAAYLSQYGLYANRSDYGINCGRNPYRKWSYRNLSWAIGFSDHHCDANLGWWQEGVQNSTVNEGILATAHFSYAEGVTVYNQFEGQINPPSIGVLDTTSKHWGLRVGDLYVISPDRISKGNGRVDTGYTLSTSIGFLNLGKCFGNNQIDDMLTAAAADNAPFKSLALTVDIRYLGGAFDASNPNNQVTGPPPNLVGTGAQQPLYNEMITEYKRLFTNTGGLQSLSSTHGWQFTVDHGDFHYPVVTKNANSTGTVAESFIHISLGAMCQSQSGYGGATVGQTFDGTTVLWELGRAMVPGHDCYILKTDIYGSRSPKEMHKTFYDSKGSVVWKGIWKEGVNGNLPVAP